MKKILIIEDDQLVANIYRNNLAVEHYEVEAAGDGETGLRTMKSFKPDAVVLDLMLPKMSGVEVLQKIRAQEAWKNLPVIVFSNTYLTNMVQQAWKAGATKCLSKASCTPKQVLDVIRNLVPQKAAPGTPQTAVEPAAGSNSGDTDAIFQADLRRTFLASLPGAIAGCRAHLQAVVKSAEEKERARHLEELYRSIHVLTGNAGMTGLHEISQMADALEALLKELYEKPKSFNASTLRTVALAIDFMGVLFEQASKSPVEPPPAPPKTNILVVDDEAISRRAVSYALEKAKLPCTALENPDAALNSLAENVYDLVFLDVDMPGMTGFEVCAKLRAFARNKSTPVVFVTSLNDFESRANSTMSGGNDLIAKPFLFMELAVKALVYILRGRMAKPAV